MMTLKKIYNKYSFYKKLKTLKMRCISIDPSVVILPTIDIHFRTKRLETSIEIKKNSVVGCGFNFESEKGFVSIGERTFINGGTNLISCSKIEIGNDVTIAWGCTLYDNNAHSIDWKERRKDILDIFEHGEKDHMKFKNWDVVKSRPIIIRDKVWIGFGCTILNGVTIGEGAIVGAQSVVRDNVDPWTIVAGNPAKFVKEIKHED